MTKMTQMHVRLYPDELKNFTERLSEDHEYPPSRSAVIRSWVNAYLEGRLHVSKETE